MNTSARAVIFDMDGVLTDSEPLIKAAAVAMFKEIGLEVKPEDFLPFVGMGEDRYLGGVAEKYAFPIQAAAAKRRTYDIYLQLVPARLHPFPGAVQLVRDCRAAGLRVAVASSADRIKVEANLAKIGLPSETWDAVITGEFVTQKKPAPDIFLAAAERLGITPGQCTVIEDAVNGIDAAKAAGMRCLAVAQTFPAETLRAADQVFARIADLRLEHLMPLAEQPPLISDYVPPTLPASLPGEAAVVARPGPSVLRAPRPWGFWASLGFGVAIGTAWIGAQGIAYAVWLGIASASGGTPDMADLESNGLLLAAATLVGMPVAAGLSWVFARLRGGINTREYLGLRRASRRRWIVSVLSLIAFIVVSDTLTTLLGRPIVPEVMVEPYHSAKPFLPLFFLALVVGAPVAEEFLFRGFVFEGLARSPLGGFGTILLTSLVWSVIHVQYDLYGIGTVFAAGLLLGYIRLRTGSVYVAMALHALMNLVAFMQLVVLHG